MEELPDDVLSSILIRLPAKLLAQSRCVCRHWNALLYQPSFVHSHLKQQHSLIHNNNGNILLVFGNFFRRHISCTVHHSTSPHVELTNFIKFPVDFPSKDHFRTSVIGSVNGLICFYHAMTPTNSIPKYTIYIWNPSLPALMTLPPFTWPLGTVFLYRFGFDPKTDDYMIVKLTCSSVENYLTVFPKVVDVYSMRRGSWQLTAERFPSHFFLSYNLGVQDLLDGHDGKVHWLAYIPQSKLNMIVAFDLGVQTFSEISLPDSVCYFDENRNLAFSLIDGKLCVMTSVRGSGQCEVWVMDQYYAWVKRHVFYHLSLDNDITPIGFTLNSEFLFRTGRHLRLYDPVTTNVKYFESHIASNCRSTEIVHYVDSLVWKAPTAAASLDRKIGKEEALGISSFALQLISGFGRWCHKMCRRIDL